MMQPSIDRAVSGQLFRVRIEDLFSQARQWMRGQGLEILTPASGEFLIGDVPALTIRYGLSQAGSWAASRSAMRIPSSCRSARVIWRHWAGPISQASFLPIRSPA